MKYFFQSDTAKINQNQTGSMFKKSVVCADRNNKSCSKPSVRKKDKISVDVTTLRVMGNCNSVTE
jgi:hypothetical protein